MAISRRGLYENPAKSPYSCERFDSDLERKMMVSLDSDPDVVKWQKRHNVVIPWIDKHGRKHKYIPDFVVEYADGQKVIIETKDPSQVDSPTVQQKAKAAKRWCKQRDMTYEIKYIE